MCCCGSTTKSRSGQQTLAASSKGALQLRVDDMTCGHCAGAIKTAIETGLPGTRVTADPASKLVSILGATDVDLVKALVTEAGYTPTLV